jgi:hypothetical protein
MDTTFTFRISAKQRAKLRRRAKLFGQSEAELLREILDRELDDRPMGERIGHLAGTVSLKGVRLDPWRAQIRKRNWRE